MTAPRLRLEADRVEVEPGGQARVGVTISNPGSIVEGYALTVLGEGAARWAEIVPPEIPGLYPGQDATAVVVFSPPAGAGAPSGTWPFGVRVESLIDPELSAVAEGDVEIKKLLGLQAKIVPVTSTGRWRGRHTVQLSNWGNTPVKIKLSGSDPDEALGLLIRPDVLDVPLGATAAAQVWVRTRRPFLRGTPVRLPFTITGETADAPAATPPIGPPGGTTPDRPTVDGALHQQPIVGRGTAAVLGLALLAAGGALAFALTRPEEPVSTDLPPGSPSSAPSTSTPIVTPPVTTPPVTTPPVTNPPVTDPPVTNSADPRTSTTQPIPPSPDGSATPVRPAELGADWVAVGITLGESNLIPTYPRQLENLIRAQGQPAGSLLSREYPELYLKHVTNPSWVVYAGPYADRSSAEAACPAVERALAGVPNTRPCFVVQPNATQ